MGQNVCPQCGAPITPGASECKYCGEKFVQQQVNQNMNQSGNQGYTGQNGGFSQQGNGFNQQQYQRQPYQQNGFVQPPLQPQYVYVSPVNPAWPQKSKIAAGILAIFLGGIGIHKFYLGKVGSGLLYLIFCWTGIPAIVGFIEGILYLCSKDEDFEVKHHVRLH